MISTEEFVKREMARTGKTEFTVAEVQEMADRLRTERIAAAPPFKGWLTPDELAQARVDLQAEQAEQR